MRENEFEKQVREKMGQLGFDPSESVWVNVDKEINKKRRRRVPLIWLFFISGLLVAGGAYYYVVNKNTLVEQKKLPEQLELSKKQGNDQTIQSVRPQQNVKGTTHDKLVNETSGVAHRLMHKVSTALTNHKAVHQAGTKGIAKKETDGTDKLVKEKYESHENSSAAVAGAIVISNNSNKSAKT
ncbi:MAG TPA: hypothetical protein VFE04_03460, partial [Puia sp.]|nr:hypothetical protein [Puia sp.]